MYEYRRRRCEHCNQHGSMSRTCPNMQFISRSTVSPCRFVKNYVDKDGNKYTILRLPNERYAVFYLAPGAPLWRRYLPVQDGTQRDDVQGRLNQQAYFLSWHELEYSHNLGDCMNVQYA